VTSASARSTSPALGYFHEQLRAPHAFQVVIDLPSERASCFARGEPIVVRARTFLSQLL